MSSEIEHLEKDIDKTQSDLVIMREAIYTLIESQKNTTKNVDALTKDMKEMVKNSSMHETNANKIISLEKRVKTIEDAKTWEYRIFIGAIISGAITLIAKFGLF